ncbi:lytic transglycosylase domain-containing protein [Streptomyces tropicalis]|uniref:Lytic transglycosylase domain-containing protein n=1 Tax=Streptomyces tropicalis TaxID=3034234 RepID=A0ABT6A2M3_9ACTN|nr:lytic transglycosylase domain-containing protein [Streptomyces tropicalis]MDF3298887.1 lytic transglycosylase domain-containing protein [Streptomyces tropicalis]
MTEEPSAVPGERTAPGAGGQTPPLRPGGYDPADYVDCAVRSAGAAGVSPVLLMAVLHNEAYKPHHPLLERLWQWWKPEASFGVANMHRATFEQVRRMHDLSGRRWEDLRDDPAFAVHAAALHLGDLDRALPRRRARRYTRDELLALGYNAGERNMRAFARGVPPGPMARSYLRRLRDNWSVAADAVARAPEEAPGAGTHGVGGE